MHEQDQPICGFRNYSNKLQICYAILEIFLKPKWRRRAASAFAQSIFCKKINMYSFCPKLHNNSPAVAHRCLIAKKVVLYGYLPLDIKNLLLIKKARRVLERLLTPLQPPTHFMPRKIRNFCLFLLYNFTQLF